MIPIELQYGGGIYELADDVRPVAVSRTGSTEVYQVEGGYLEVQHLKSGRLVGGIDAALPNWVRPVNYQWARERQGK